MIARLRHAVDWRLRAVVERLDSLAGRTQQMEARLQALEQQLTLATTEIQRLLAALPQAAEDAAAVRSVLGERFEPMLRAVVDEDAGNRRRLHALRDDPGYAAPFTDPDPLVSVTIATRDRPDLLVSRALPSVLAQTHRRLEVLIVGDAAGPAVAAAVAGVGDPRVHYANLTQRTVAHPEPWAHRLVGSTLPRNEAMRRAQGSWVLHFDDDDSLRPDMIAALLALARETRAEVVYGGLVEHQRDGSEVTIGGFPPEPGKFAWQGALMHSGLRFFERELVAAHLGITGDLYLLERMLRAGVSFAMLDRAVWDYFPSAWREPATTAQTSSTASGSSSP